MMQVSLPSYCHLNIPCWQEEFQLKATVLRRPQMQTVHQPNEPVNKQNAY